MKKISIATFTLALLLVSVSFNPSNAQEIGIQMGSMRHMYKEGIPAVLARIKELGVTELEGGSPRGMKREEFKKLLSEYGLKIVAVGGNFERLQNKDSIQRIITNAKELGAQYVVCYWIPHDGDNFTYENMKKGVEVFNEAGKTLKENGLALTYHPHGYEFRPYESGTMFDFLVKNTDPKYLNFEMDVFWVKHPGQDPVALLKKYPQRFALMHLKDRQPGTEGNQTGEADVETNVVLGQGDVNIAAVMAEAKKIGIKHYFIEDESSRSVEQIPLSLDYLHQLK